MVARVRSFPIASINLEKGHPDEHPLDDLTLVRKRFPKAKIIGGQEAKEYRGIFDEVPGMDVAIPRGAKGDAINNPIWYDPDELHLLTCVADRIHPGKSHAYPARYINTAMFRWQVDGSVIFYNNTHLNSHIEVAGHPRPLPRVHLSTDHLHDLADGMKGDAKGYSLAFCGGDFNVDEDADNRVHWSGFPEAIFKKYGIESIYDELGTPKSFKTHDSRKIDVIASYKGDGRVTGRKVERIDTSLLHTDHDAICATYGIRTLRAA